MKPVNMAIICLAILIAGILFWPTLYRYEKTTEFIQLRDYKKEDTVITRINRLTGHTEIFEGGKWISEKKASERAQEERLKNLPLSDLTKLPGNAYLGDGEFKGRIYNGSDWTVEEVVFRVFAKEKDGSVRWDRKFLGSFSYPLSPLKTESFSVNVTGEEGIDSFDWSIVEAKGFK